MQIRYRVVVLMVKSSTHFLDCIFSLLRLGMRRCHEVQCLKRCQEKRHRGQSGYEAGFHSKTELLTRIGVGQGRYDVADGRGSRVPFVHPFMLHDDFKDTPI